jgi:hypothetical protein
MSAGGSGLSLPEKRLRLGSLRGVLWRFCWAWGVPDRGAKMGFSLRLRHFILNPINICQDRLGTNVETVEKKERFSVGVWLHLQLHAM